MCCTYCFEFECAVFDVAESAAFDDWVTEYLELKLISCGSTGQCTEPTGPGRQHPPIHSRSGKKPKATTSSRSL